MQNKVKEVTNISNMFSTFTSREREGINQMACATINPDIYFDHIDRKPYI